MSLQERTLVVKNFDPEKTTSKLLKELCIQGGPVRNVVVKPDHAFVEYEDVESVGYTKALLDGIELFGRKLVMEPKLKTVPYFKFSNILRDYILYDKFQQQQQHLLLLQQQQQQMYLQPEPVRNNQEQAQFVQPQSSVCGSVASNVNYVQNPDPQIFNQSTFVAQDYFNSGSTVAPSTHQRNDSSLNRSRSFNHHIRPFQSRQQRERDWSRRR